MSLPKGRSLSRPALLAGFAAVALAAAGCGSSKRAVDDRAQVDACVLTGATTNDGCDLATGGGPAVKLGDLTMGALKTRDVALYDGGAGQVAATISAISLDGTSTANYAVLKLFKLDATSQEVPVTLPFDLAVNHGSELRARVSFTANAPIGAVSGVSLKVVASHPAATLLIPITGQITGCPAGKGDCDGDPTNGCEVDLQSAAANCGACGTVCGSANATAACVNGTCDITCAAGFGNCDGNSANGCETDLTTTATHCGACGTACGTANGTASCTAGVCGITCAAGFGNCDGDPRNGCETSTVADLNNCGGCGTVCGATNGTPSCTAGSCAITCAPGFANCDGNFANGCEANLATDPAHCGACATACNSTNGTATCTAATCGITCAPGFANCDGSAGNGCEVNLGSNVANCGACGHVCSAPGAASSCTAGACTFTCNPGFLDCNGLPADGCEVNVTSDLANCGACGTVCAPANASGACTAGSCTVAACTGTFADCNGLVADGCEIDTAADVANCGGCGKACALANATAGCSASACTVAACTGTFRDCNGLAADGCEIDTATSLANCGACGALCAPANATGASCAASACTFTGCAPGFYDMDGLAADGCECAADVNPDTCAAAGSLGTIALGGTISISGSLLPLSKSEYFTVSFPSNTALTYHPKITVSSPSGIARFDVLVDCGGAAAGSCALEGGTPLGMTAWETYYTGGDPGAYWGAFNPIPAPGTGGTVVVRVYAAASTTTCGTFTLTVSN